MCSPIQDILLLVLGISLDLGLVTIDKGLGISQALTKKGFPLLPHDRDFAHGLVLPLVLLPTEVYAVTQERCCKGNTVEALSPDGSKVILTLLTEVITFYVEFTTIALGDLALNGFSQTPSERGAWAPRTILRIF